MWTWNKKSPHRFRKVSRPLNTDGSISKHGQFSFAVEPTGGSLSVSYPVHFKSHYEVFWFAFKGLKVLLPCAPRSLCPPTHPTLSLLFSCGTNCPLLITHLFSLASNIVHRTICTLFIWYCSSLILWILLCLYSWISLWEPLYLLVLCFKSVMD